jgi:hypothetical protein
MLRLVIATGLVSLLTTFAHAADSQFLFDSEWKSLRASAGNQCSATNHTTTPKLD